MTFNFWFLTGGKNAASTIQAIQRATGPSGPPDARPRAPLPIADRVEAYMEDSQQPVIVAPTHQNLAPRRAPAPRPQNVEILTQRAKSVRDSKKVVRRKEVGLLKRLVVESLGFKIYHILLKIYLQGSGFHLSNRFHKECGTHPFKTR